MRRFLPTGRHVPPDQLPESRRIAADYVVAEDGLIVFLGPHIHAATTHTCLVKAARTCGRYVNGEYRFEILHGVSHWMLDERPAAVADLLLQWFTAHSA